jgi:gamma-glutamyltranspeptidase/glutathione hydrolase
MVRRLAAVLLGILVCLPLQADSSQVSHGRGGAVAAAEETATRVGIEILGKGGNAADAAVAVAFALAVTWPEAGNIGGGGFWLSRDAGGRALVVDFREAAPQAARRDLFLRPGPDGRAPSSTVGPLASGVPGSVAGLERAHRLSGRLAWKTVLEPAVRLARDGFIVSESVSKSIAREKKGLARDPETAQTFLPGGAPPAPGSLWKQPQLARTLESIRDHGADGFYRGRVARQIEDGQRRAGGLISRGDLARYEARVRQPIRFAFQDAEILTTPAPSSGPVLAEMAMLAEFVGLEKIALGDALSAHYLAEIEKRAYADRNRYLADPSHARVEEALFTDAARLRAIAARIPRDRATPSDSLETPSEKPTTTHFSVMDSSGGAVSVTTTLNDSFGNERVAPGLGFLWNNEMDDFTTRPGEKNLYGLVQGPINSVAPGKRMLSSMCPSIAVISGRNALVWGSPGGATIPTTNLQVMLNVLLRGETLEAAVAAPRFHQQNLPDKIQYEEGRFDSAWIAALEKLGHAVVVRTEDQPPQPALLGRVHAIARDASDGMTAVADPRSAGVGLVVHPEP